jgi:hypothetical protein
LQILVGTFHFNSAMDYNAVTFSSDEDDFDLEHCTNLAMKMHFMKTPRCLKSGRYLLAGQAIKMLLTLNAAQTWQ